MQAVLERKEQYVARHRPETSMPGAPCENWLFLCDRCGQPICYDEPLQVHSTNGQVEVAHVQCTHGV